jgi:eukaryotic-like serine/threonine-protein kinase
VLSPSNVSGLGLNWVTTAGAEQDLSPPAVVNGVVYIGAEDGNVYALNAATGAEKWSYPTGVEIVNSSPAVVNGVVYIGSYNGEVYALNAATGAKEWSYTTGGTSFPRPRWPTGSSTSGPTTARCMR